jgi:tight adherence protein B
LNFYIISIALFAIAFLLAETLIFAFRTWKYPDRQNLKRRLVAQSSNLPQEETVDLLKKQILSEIPAINVLLRYLPGIRPLTSLVVRANSSYTPGFFVLLSVTLFVVCWAFGFFIMRNNGLALLPAVVGSTLPFLYLKSKKDKRAHQFEVQLPDALDLIARALRAGHAFATGLKLASDEFKDPLGPLFGETITQINFGLSVNDALKDLAERIECADLKFFIVSVILQRETGGNLADIIENIGNIIRERFKLRGKIRALAAEGKISAIILSVLPFFIVGWLAFWNPEWIGLLWTNASGRLTAGGALLLMLAGIYVMKRMINIRF